MSGDTFTLDDLNGIVDLVKKVEPGEYVLLSDGVVRWAERKSDGKLGVVMTEEAYKNLPRVDSET